MRGRNCWSLVLAFAIPAGAVWGAIGAAWNWIIPTEAATAIALGLATVYGVSELADLRLPTPTFPFGTPASWLRGVSAKRQEVIWGITLGPGLLTRNPYAGMWVSLAALGMLDSPIIAGIGGAIAGAAHGAARSIGIRQNMRRERSAADVMELRLRWRLVDGVVLVGFAMFVAVGLG